MKLLYFTTASDPKQYEEIQKQSRVKASIASQVFESALLSGLSAENDLELTLHSFPMIAAFPGSRKLLWGAKNEQTAGGFSTTWLPTVNLYGLKQWTQRHSARRAVKRWLKATDGTADRAILLYSVFEPIADAVLRYAGKAGCKAYVIVPDLPCDMYKTLSGNPIKASMQKRYMRRAEALQGCFDGYIYLTESMRQVVAPDKPYMIMEGIADVSAVRPPAQAEKTRKRAIMYAGALSSKYGLQNLVAAFNQLQLPNTELWFFGSGSYEAQLKEAAASNPCIRCYGRVNREDVLTYERKATLLVNVRDPKEAFTKYSFPSKTIEYMLSGTPLLSTALQGIPEDYRPYVFWAEDNRAETLCTAIREILALPPDELNAFGSQAQQYISNQKNATIQAQRLLALLREG